MTYSYTLLMPTLPLYHGSEPVKCCTLSVPPCLVALRLCLPSSVPLPKILVRPPSPTQALRATTGSVTAFGSIMDAASSGNGTPDGGSRNNSGGLRRLMAGGSGGFAPGGRPAAALDSTSILNNVEVTPVRSRSLGRAGAAAGSAGVTPGSACSGGSSRRIDLHTPALAMNPLFANEEGAEMGREAAVRSTAVDAEEEELGRMAAGRGREGGSLAGPSRAFADADEEEPVTPTRAVVGGGSGGGGQDEARGMGTVHRNLLFDDDHVSEVGWADVVCCYRRAVRSATRIHVHCMSTMEWPDSFACVNSLVVHACSVRFLLCRHLLLHSAVDMYATTHSRIPGARWGLTPTPRAATTPPPSPAAWATPAAWTHTLAQHPTASACPLVTAPPASPQTTTHAVPPRWNLS